MKLLRTKQDYLLKIVVPCKRGIGCSLVASYDPQMRWFSPESLYCLDKPNHFCACVVKTKKGEEKTSENFLAIKVDREILDEVKIATVLKEIRNSKISEKVIKNIKHGKIRSVEEIRQVMEKETEKISQNIEPILSGDEYSNYILYSDLRGKLGILPFTPENFEKLRSIGRYYVNMRSRTMKL